jgi:peptidoglycan/xylan/chitin deacetylase (PgdA/CDA1 family)
LRRLILLFACVAPVVFLCLVWRAPWTSLGILALSHALLLYPTLRPSSQWLGPVITRFETSRRELWLTIDDGPTDDTPALLDILRSRGVRATFFLKGSLASLNEHLVRSIVDGGHTVGNHSQTHPSGSFWCLPRHRILREIDDCNRTLASIVGAPPALFRAPVGMKNPFVHPALSHSAMRLVGWSVRAYDAVNSDVDAIVRSVEKQLAPGAVVVLHQGRTWSLRAIDGVIAAAQSAGYDFIVPDASRLKTNR